MLILQLNSVPINNANKKNTNVLSQQKFLNHMKLFLNYGELFFNKHMVMLQIDIKPQLQLFKSI